jgi:hypothetical protein
MEGFPQSSMEDDVNVTSNLFDLQSLEDTFMSELLLYVILKHILSEDDCLQFSYSSIVYSQETIMLLTMEAGRHRRFQATKAPYYAMIKMDRTWWWITM